MKTEKEIVLEIEELCRRMKLEEHTGLYRELKTKCEILKWVLA